jgi:hypothetical protein
VTVNEWKVINDAVVQLRTIAAAPLFGTGEQVKQLGKIANRLDALLTKD